MPAVSTIRKVRLCHFSTASTVSRVVPGMSLTIERSSLSSRLSSDDLPTLGRPTMAIAVSSEVSLAGLRPVRQRAHDLVEQVAHPLAVLGGDLDDRLEPHLVELEHASARLLVVGLVDGQQYRRRRFPQGGGDLLVTGHEPFAAVHHEHHDVCRLDRPLPLHDDQLVQRILAGAEHPPGIHQPERRLEPLGRFVDHIARRAGDRGDDRPPGTRDPVEQGRFADVWPADQHDRRQPEGSFHSHVERPLSTLLDSVSPHIYDSYNSRGVAKHDQS